MQSLDVPWAVVDAAHTAAFLAESGSVAAHREVARAEHVRLPVVVLCLNEFYLNPMPLLARVPDNPKLWLMIYNNRKRTKPSIVVLRSSTPSNISPVSLCGVRNPC
jgi:hypothetical protein